MNNNLPKFTDQQKGIALIVVGAILLLYTLKIFMYSGIFIIIIAAAMILYGLMESGLYDRIMKLFKKHTK